MVAKPNKPKATPTAATKAKTKAAKNLSAKNEKFYKDPNPRASASRPKTWKGGSVAANQKKPRESLDPAKYSRDDANDFDNSKGGNATRNGSLAIFAARRDAKKASEKLKKPLTRKGK